MTAAPPPAGAIDLRPLFAPESIAVVGASARGGIAGTVRDNLRATGSSTRCHFVNPRHTELLGQPCHPTIESLPERPDVVIVALNPLRAAAAVRAAAEAGVPAAIVPGGGVVEGGQAAAAMQSEVAAIARDHGMALVGPNCMGVWDLTTNASAYIGDVSPFLPRGGVAAIAQSGSVTDAFIQSGNRIGFSRIIGSGSEVVLDLCDYLAYCLDDPETTGLILFVEGFRRPERFLALADQALAAGIPIAMVKVGRSAQAQDATLAHTGTLAGEARAIDAALDAVGVIRCGDLDELLEQAELLAGCRRLGRTVGTGRTGVVTVSTGEASLIADLVPRTGLDLPPLPDTARTALLAELPTLGYVGNPLDPWGAADTPVAYAAAFRALADAGAFDVLAVVHDSPYRELPSEVEVAREVTTALLDATRDRLDLLPVYVSLTSGEPSREVKSLLDEAGGVPLLRGAVESFCAIARAATWEADRKRRADDGPVRPEWPTLAADRTSFANERPSEERLPADRALVSVPERESLALLRSHGIHVIESVAAQDPAGAVAAADRLGYPVAVKADADGLAHKSDVGAVRLGLADADAVASAVPQVVSAARVTGATVRGVLVQPMAPPGIELIVGARRDPLVGPVVLVGLGGVLAELIDDVAVGLAPLDPDRAVAVLGRLRAAAVLDGLHGRPSVSRQQIARLLVAVGDLMVREPGIVELDLNPVVASPVRTVAVDALVVVNAS